MAEAEALWKSLPQSLKGKLVVTTVEAHDAYGAQPYFRERSERKKVRAGRFRRLLPCNPARCGQVCPARAS
jgi:hypothetical protein